MQKLSSELVKRILQAGLTQSELANLLQISRIQDSTGYVRGLSYKYTNGILGKCIQTFYNAKKGLEEKGFIRTEKADRSDIDVHILDNDFSGKDFSKGYIDLQMRLFDDAAFYGMSANEMAMALDFLRIRFNEDTAHQGKDAKKLIQHYMDVFKVTERSVRKYLHSLKKYFHINLARHKYFIQLRTKWDKSKKGKKKPEEDKFREHIAETACRRAKVVNKTETVINDLKVLAKNYTSMAAGKGKDIGELLVNAVQESIDSSNRMAKEIKTYKISVPFVHVILREYLGIFGSAK